MFGSFFCAKTWSSYLYLYYPLDTFEQPSSKKTAILVVPQKAFWLSFYIARTYGYPMKKVAKSKE